MVGDYYPVETLGFAFFNELVVYFPSLIEECICVSPQSQILFGISGLLS